MPAKEKYTRILWLDLEATGSKDDADIIEIGAVLTDLDFNVQDQYQKVYNTLVDFKSVDPVVKKMHSDNGLWLEVWKAPRMFVEPESEADFLKFLGPDKNHILLAGSGVSHYDRRYIKRDWPRVDRRLTYYSLDIGVIRRFLKLSYQTLEPAPDNKNHRALDDTLGFIEEAKEYREIMRLGFDRLVEKRVIEPLVKGLTEAGYGTMVVDMEKERKIPVES